MNKEELNKKVGEIKADLVTLKKEYRITQQDVHKHLELTGKFTGTYSTFNKYVNGTYPGVTQSKLNPIIIGVKKLLSNPQSLQRSHQKRGLMSNIIKYLVNQGGWWLYHYNDNANFIARSSLLFKSDNTVEIINPNATKERTSLVGAYEVSEQILKINIPKNDGGIELIILLQLYDSGAPDVILGQYISPNLSSNITTGAVVVERKEQKDIEECTPPTIFSNKGLALKHYTEVVHESIRKYFCSKQQNYQKTPNKKIVDHSSLFDFIDRYFTKDDDILNHKYDFFISSPVFSCNKDKKFKEIRETIMKIIEIIKEQGYDRIKYIGEDITDAKIFRETQKANLTELGQAHFIVDLIESKHHFVFLPAKHSSTGIFIEIGISLRQNKPLTIFFESENDLPFMLRKLRDKHHHYPVQFSPVKSINDVCNKIKGKNIHDFLPKH